MLWEMHMAIIRHDPLSWEPLVLCVYAHDDDAAACAALLRDVILRWFASRAAFDLRNIPMP
jgi:hypothetical protein